MNKYIDSPVKENFSQMVYRYHKLMRVQFMKLEALDASSTSQCLTGTQVSIQDFQDIGKQSEFHSLGAIFYFDSHWLAFTFSQKLFWPLEQVIGQNVKLHWSDTYQWPLFVEALLGQLSGLKITTAMLGHGDEAGYPVVADFSKLLDKMNLVKVFDLAIDRQEFDDQIKSYCLTESVGLNLNFQSDKNNSTDFCMIMKPKLLDGLANHVLQVSKKSGQNNHMISTLSVEVTLLKPFQELAQDEINDLAVGDGVGMSKQYKNVIWVRVGQQDSLLKIDLESPQEKFEYELISINPAKNSFCSFGIRKLVSGVHWLSDWEGEIKKGIAELHQKMTNDTGWFYLGNESMVPASVTEYQGQPVLRIEP